MWIVNIYLCAWMAWRVGHVFLWLTCSWCPRGHITKKRKMTQLQLVQSEQFVGALMDRLPICSPVYCDCHRAKFLADSENRRRYNDLRQQWRQLMARCLISLNCVHRWWANEELVAKGGECNDGSNLRRGGKKSHLGSSKQILHAAASLFTNSMSIQPGTDWTHISDRHSGKESKHLSYQEQTWAKLNHFNKTHCFN